jgi:hypothetical protein
MEPTALVCVALQGSLLGELNQEILRFLRWRVAINIRIF